MNIRLFDFSMDNIKLLLLFKTLKLPSENPPFAIFINFNLLYHDSQTISIQLSALKDCLKLLPTLPDLPRTPWKGY